jgi:hypothetical protein
VLVHNWLTLYHSSCTVCDMKFIRIKDESLYEKLHDTAEKQDRSDTNMLAVILRKYFGEEAAPEFEKGFETPVEIREKLAKPLIASPQREPVKGLVLSITRPPKKDEVRTKLSFSKDRFNQGVCKIHGLPLDSRGRCMQKGCKYGEK